jgi:hypothetical protein
VAGGIVSVVLATSASSVVQTQLAKLQEEGRFAVASLTADLRMANAIVDVVEVAKGVLALQKALLGEKEPERKRSMLLGLLKRK